MENKINIAEILKDCPSGMELDCTIWDNVVFDHIDTTSNYPIYIKKMGGELEYLTEDGHFNFDCDAKCVIFPKGKTTWEGFQRPFKDGDILVGKNHQPFIFEKLNDGDGCYSYCGISCVGEFWLASTDWTFANSLRFATEEEKKKLFDAIKDNGYKWNADTKTLEKLVEPKFKVGDRIKSIGSDKYYIIKTIEFDRYILNNDCFLRFNDEHMFELVIEPKFKVGDRIKAICNNCQYDIKEITDTHYNLVEVEYKLKYTEPISEDKNWELVPNKFDITTLKPFDKVLVRCGNNGLWNPQFFAKYRPHSKFPFTCTYNSWSQCVPYEGNEHLLDTTDNCDEFYKIWE